MMTKKTQGITRRKLLANLPAIPLLSGLKPWVAWGEERDGPPIAKLKPVVETFFGERIVDDYRWMEDSTDPDWQPFLVQQADYARSVLDTLPHRKELLERVTTLSADSPLTTQVEIRGSRMFYEKRPAGSNTFKLFFRDRIGATESILFDPAAVKNGNSHHSIDWWTSSPDGEHVALGISPAGSENSVTQIINVANGKTLPERIDRTQYASPVWLPDSSGFFFNRLSGAAAGSTDYYQNSVAWLHKIGTDPEDDLKVLASGQYPDIRVDTIEFPAVVSDPSSSFVYAVLYGGVRRENPVYVAKLSDVVAGRPQWKKVCDVLDEVVSASLYGEHLYLLTTRDAENGKVLRVSAADPDFEQAEVMVQESDVVIEYIVAARDGLYMLDIAGGYSTLRRMTWNGNLEMVELPFEGSIVSLFATTEKDGLWIGGSSWLLPRTTWYYDPKTKSTNDLGLTPPSPLDLSEYEAVRTIGIARDGTEVPISIVKRKDLKPNGSNPTLVSAYGAYQIVYSPYFDPRSLAFLEQGGILATAHVRGGGEFGKRWWKGGQKLTKPNTWRDLIDCCEALIKAGWTKPDHLAIQGGSAGGITVGRALTERPDLFAVVISNVGVGNPLRAEFSQNGPPNIVEFGTVTERDGFIALKQMDSVHAVRDNVPYPAVLLTHGATDPRVEPWQSAKFAARLQRATSSEAPVLLRITFDAGHGLGSTRNQTDQQRADEYAFILAYTRGPQSPS